MAQQVLFLEPVGGIAGDMFLAAALDLGVSLDALTAQLKTLKLDGWKFALSRSARHSIVGTHVDVEIEAHPHAHDHDHDHPHDHPHGEHDHHHHDEHDHHHGDHDTNSGHHPHGTRGLKEIRAVIQGSGLSALAKERSLKVFTLIGEAEAKIHGVSVDEIHFHEVGAVDSIVDVCGAAVVLELLGNPTVYASPPPLGSGTVRIAHGVVPVPVPATLELLRGLPVKYEGVGELTTPTGAALLKAFATIGPPPAMTVDKVGYGVGTKDFADRANVLRATLGSVSAGLLTETLTVLEANLDDCSPQLLGALLEQLLETGALDAWVTPVTMKKSRPGHVLAALVPDAAKAACLRVLLSESTTLGVRQAQVQRTSLQRRFDTVKTRYGELKVKVGFEGATVLNAAPEFDEARALARAARVPVKTVLAEALAVWRASQG